MNLPTLIEKQAFKKLPLNLQEYVSLRLEPPVKELNHTVLKDKCHNLISISFIEQAQYSVESKILAHQRDTLLDELRTVKAFGSLTWSEVEKAFKTGIRGESGQFFGMCAKTYHQFLKYYVGKPERVEGMKQYLELMNQENKVELTPEQKKQKSKEALVWYFNEYKRTKKLGSGSFAMYESLYYGFGLCRFSEVEALDLKNSVQKKWDEYEKNPKKNHYKAMFEGDILEQAPTLKGNLRKEALTRYFDKLIKEGIELETIIK